jgi:hypothetical protein
MRPTTTRLFHAISYLQYPLMLVGLYFAVRAGMAAPRMKGEGSAMVLAAANHALVFAGLAISFSTLQDTSTTQNEFSRKIWQSPRKGMIALWAIALSTAAMLLVGLYGFFASTGALQELATGLMMLGLGYVGLLKSAVEMFENHRTDKPRVTSSG